MLHELVKTGSLDKIKTAVGQGADVNAVDDAKWTPLHVAALRGNVSIIEFLVDRGAKLNAKTQRKWTPLHVAVKAKHDEAVKLLLEFEPEDCRKGAYYVKNARRQTPMQVALAQIQDAIEQYVPLTCDPDESLDSVKARIEAQRLDAQKCLDVYSKFALHEWEDPWHYK